MEWTQEMLEHLSIKTLKAVINDLSKVADSANPKAGRGKAIDWFLLDCIELYNSKVAPDERILIIEK